MVEADAQSIEDWLLCQSFDPPPVAVEDPSVLRRWRWNINDADSQQRGVPAFDLVLPLRFPKVSPEIYLPLTAPLTVPNLEEDGSLCLETGLSPGTGATPVEMVHALLLAFRDQYFMPWLQGELEDEFLREPRNYWGVHVNQYYEQHPKRDSFFLNQLFHIRSAEDDLFQEGTLLQQSGIAVFGGNARMREAYLKSLSAKAEQTRVEISIISIKLPVELKPAAFPRNVRDIHRIVGALLSGDDLRLAITRLVHGMPKGRPVALVLQAPRMSYAFRVSPMSYSNPNASSSRFVMPIRVKAIDAAWMLGRDQREEVDQRQRQHVLLLGAGSLASGLADQLARAGAGHLTVVDPDTFDSPNVARHELGFDSIGLSKSERLAAHLMRAVPCCKVTAIKGLAEEFLESCDLSTFSLLIDATGEFAVRRALEEKCANSSMCPPRLIGWLEPYVAAAHAVMLLDDSQWLGHTGQDPLLDLEAYEWDESIMRHEPGCSAVFQSYSAASLSYAIGLLAEAAVELLDGKVPASAVRSWVRGQSFLTANSASPKVRPWAEPALKSPVSIIERPWDD